MKDVWLVQRGEFRDTKLEDITGLDSLLRLEYMGAVEFECGSLPQSSRRIVEDLDKYAFSTITIEDQPVGVLCRVDESTEVYAAIRDISLEKLRLKEWTNFPAALGKDTRRHKVPTNFWWDVQNDFMFWLGGKAHDIKMAAAISALRKRWHP